MATHELILPVEARELGLKKATLTTQVDKHRILIEFDRTKANTGTMPGNRNLDQNLQVDFTFTTRGKYGSYGVITRGGTLPGADGQVAMRALHLALEESLRRKRIAEEFIAHRDSLNAALTGKK